jgi:hypothetical protein
MECKLSTRVHTASSYICFPSRLISLFLYPVANHMYNAFHRPWCDPSATPTAGSCDGTEFNGVHFFPDEDIFCQWDVDASTQVRCIDGQTGDDVDPPARKRSIIREEPRMANFTALLHIREPELVNKLPNEERERSLRQRASRITRLV